LGSAHSHRTPGLRVPSAVAPVPAPDPEPARHPPCRAPQWPRGPTPTPPPPYRSPPVTAMAPAVAAAASAAVSQALRERQILDAVGTGAAALSLVGSSFIVLCYLLFRELRKFSFKLVFYLAVSVSGLLGSRNSLGLLV
jgi:hypothetical protein